MMFVEKYIKIYSVYECVNEFACVEMINIYVARKRAVCVRWLKEGRAGCKYVLKVLPKLPRVPGITSEDFDIKYILEETQ